MQIICSGTVRNALIETTKIIDQANNRKELLIKESLHIQEKSDLIIIQYKKFTNVLKLFEVYTTIERNKTDAKNDSVISFNENQIEFYSTPINT